MKTHSTLAILAIAAAALAEPGFAGTPLPAPTLWEFSGQFQNVTNPAGPGAGTPKANSVWHSGFHVPVLSTSKAQAFTCPTHVTNQVNQANYAGWNSGSAVPVVAENTATVPLLFGK